MWAQSYEDLVDLDAENKNNRTTLKGHPNIS